MMKALNKRLLPIVIAMSMLVSLWGQAAAHAAENEDSSVQSDLSGHWAEVTMMKWAKSGLLQGNSQGQYRPNDAVTRAEFAALLYRVFQLPQQPESESPFRDVNKDAWYREAVAAAFAAGFVQGVGDEAFAPTATITRQDAAVIVARAFQVEEDAQTAESFRDAEEIVPYAAAAVAALHIRHFVSGRDEDRFAPQDSMTRAEVIRMIDTVMGTLIAKKGTFEQDYPGNVVVNTAGVELKNLVIGGDLYITQGVGEGDIVLDGVTVKGKTYVFGGGGNSVRIKDSQLAGTLTVNKRGAQVRVFASGTTSIPQVLMLSGGILEEGELTGGRNGFEDVRVTGGNVLTPGEIALLGRFGQVHYTGNGSLFDLKPGSIVEVLILDGAATVTGEGSIRTANLNVNGSILSKWPDFVNFANKVTAIIASVLADHFGPHPSPSTTPSTSPSAEPTSSSSPTPGSTPSPTSSPPPSSGPSAEPTSSPSTTPTPTSSTTPGTTPSSGPSAEPTPSSSPTPGPTSSATPEPTPSSSPSAEPSPSLEPAVFKIVEEGDALASVVVNGSADEQTREAAQKLIKYIKKSTGVELPLLVDRQHADKVTAENGVIQIEFLNPPAASPVSEDFKVQTIIDGGATANEHPAGVTWNEAAKTATLTVTRIEKANVQQSVKYQIRYKDEDAFVTPTIIIPANPHGSLLKNPSFEAGYTGYYNAAPWQYWNGGFEAPASLVTRSAEQARTGTYSLKLSGTSLVWPNQNVALTSYGQYEYTAYLYTPQGSTTSGTVQMFVNLQAEDGVQLKQDLGPVTATNVSNGNWEQMKLIFDIPEQINGKQVVKALVGFEGANFAAGETVYIDDATLINMDTVDQDVPVNGNEHTGEQDLSEQYEGFQIYLGKKGLTAQEQNELLEGTDVDGFVIHQNGKRLTIAGPTAWGTEFGVNEFLERYVGVRWLMPGEDWEDVPKAASLTVPAGDEVKQEPAFFSRAFEEQLAELPVRAEWAQNLRMHDKIKFTHNIFQMFPVAQYPQFYRPGTVDKRWETEHPCFQADGIVEEAIRMINAYFDAHPEATSYSVGMNDTAAFCEADPSGELNSIGFIDMSDIYFDWLDKVSEGVFAAHPDKYLGAYAYFNLYDPPTHVKLDPRVVVYITDERVSWGDPDMKTRAHAVSQAWTQVGATVAFYDYVYGSPYVLPRTPFQLLADEYRYAASIGVGAYYSELYANFGEGPKPYLSAKLQWDPQQDVDALLNDWYERAVGAEAAADLKAYYEFWQRFWEQDIYETEWYQTWKNMPVRTNFMPLNSPDYLRDASLEDIAASRQLLESVVVKAQTPQQKKRANDLLRMFEYYELSKQSYTDMKAEIAEPTNDAEASAILDNILDRNAKMDQRKALIAEFADYHTSGVYFQYKGALSWGGVSSKEIKVLSGWITAHPDSEVVDRIEQLSENSPYSAVRNAMKLLLLSMDGTTIKNPGFEAGLEEWFNFPDTVAELTNDTHSGNQAVKVRASSVEQEVFVESGKTYRLTFYAKASGEPDINVVGINFWDVPGVGLTGAHVTVDSAEYKKYTVTFTPPEGFSHATIVVYKAAGAGWVYADDFAINEFSADELALTTVTGSNGTVQAIFNKSPEMAPVAADFTVQAIVDGQEALTEQPVTVSWENAAHTATLTVPIVTPAYLAQTVQYRVTYKDGDTVASPEVVIAADPQASVLRNTSFEIRYGADEYVRPWSYGCGGNPATCLVAQSNEQARTGQHSLKLSGTIWAIWPSQTVTLTDFGQYAYTAYLYTPQGATAGGTIQMFAILQAADGTQLTTVAGPLTSAAASNGDWHPIQWTFAIPDQVNGTPVASALVGLEALNFGAGEASYLDDVTLVKE